MNLTDAARPVFDELLGKIDDPMQTILTGTNKLSSSVLDVMNYFKH